MARLMPDTTLTTSRRILISETGSLDLGYHAHHADEKGQGEHDQHYAHADNPPILLSHHTASI